MTIRLAAMISGGGRTLLNLLDVIENGRLDATIPVVVASREDCAGVERARSRGLLVEVGSRRAFDDADARDDAIAGWLAEHEVDLVVLCGYLIHVRIDPALEGRVLNIHPALLPRHGGRGMYGDHVHRSVLEAGDRWSGCTVHFVDDQYDHGPVLLQRACPVRADDDVASLAARVFVEECRAYPDAIDLVARGRVRLDAGRVTLRDPAALASAENA